MSNDFNRYVTNPVTLDIQRSMINRKHRRVLSGNVGDLIPFYVDTRVLPGDTIRFNTSKVIRLMPMVTPVFDDIYADVFYFFIPHRLVWSHFKNFMGENTDTAWVPQTSYTVPQIEVPSGGFAPGTIADYMGVPSNMGAGMEISALPFRAYALVCNEWFRSTPTQNPVHVHVDDTTRTGVNTGDQVTDIELGGKCFRANKLHDQFTSALPGPQFASGPLVEFALNGLLPVNSYANKSNVEPNTNRSELESLHFRKIDSSGNISNMSSNKIANFSSGGAFYGSGTAAASNIDYAVPYNLFADLNNTSIFDINSLRQAFAIQRYYEKMARGGDRYISMIKSFYGVESPDSRLQRPEFLGGNRIPLNVSSEIQTSASQSGLTPQGNPVGYSHTGDMNDDFIYSATEHGTILGLICLRYHHTYQQGLDRMWRAKTLFDWYNPTFANLGEVGIEETELYFDSGSTGIFGYQEAWYDYRADTSYTSGQMRSTSPTPLDMWHFGDNYTSKPYLSDNWMREDPTNVDRCLAVTSEVSNQFMVDIMINDSSARPMPLYSIPGLIDHH